MIPLSEPSIVPFDPKNQNVASFDCGDMDLSEFLRDDASRYQESHVSFTRLAFLGEELVGYVTLLNDSIVLKSGEKRKLVDFHQQVMQWPALKIGRLAVSKARQRKFGVGKALLQYSFVLALRIGLEHGVGCRFMTVDAYPGSVSFYEKYGFVLNKNYIKENDSHPSMRYDILKGPEIK